MIFGFKKAKEQRARDKAESIQMQARVELEGHLFEAELARRLGILHLDQYTKYGLISLLLDRIEALEAVAKREDK